jgi:hypothetical protein
MDCKTCIETKVMPMFAHQTVNLHLPMMIGTARDLIKRGRAGRGLGQLGYGLGQNYLPSDDWWQRYVYDTTQGALRVLGARYGEGEYYSVDDPRFRQVQQPLPSTNLTIRPTSTTNTQTQPKEEGVTLSTTQIMMIAGAALLYFAGKRGR